jgi:hypothetical protein
MYKLIEYYMTAEAMSEEDALAKAAKADVVFQTVPQAKKSKKRDIKRLSIVFKTEFKKLP